MVAAVPDLAGQSVPHPDPELSSRSTAAFLLAALFRMQQAAGVPIFEAPLELESDADGVLACIPSLGRSLGPVTDLLESLLALVSSPGPTATQRLRSAFELVKSTGFPGGNLPRLLKAAHDLRMPVQELPGRFFQYGQGAYARWLDSTTSDRTAQIAVQLSGNKLLAAALLRRAGLPVPDHRAVDTAETAVRVAGELGYPVVVKPADMDGGAGVSAGLRNAAEVRTAFVKAARLSKRILVEKHVEGADYRLTVLDGEVIWAVERQPAGVTGDGVRTIAALVDAANADPRRGEGANAPLKRLVLDEEAVQLLAADGLDPATTPEAGRFVRLRRVANVASGGMPIAAFDRLHPDNARLAARAAGALGLDLAGIDLLIPDIARSWLETGAAICEVNSQPQIGGTTSLHVYPEILRRMVGGDGRMTSALAVGDSAVACRLAAACSGLAIGTFLDGQVRLGEETLAASGQTLRAAGDMLALDRRAEAMVLCTNEAEDLEDGLPTPALDVLLIAGSPGQQLMRAVKAIIPGCDGVVVTLGLDASQIDALKSSARCQILGAESLDLAVEAAAAEMMAAAARRSGAG